MTKFNLQYFGGRGGGSGMSSSASSRGGGGVRFTSQEMEDASDDYWNSGWSNKKEAARIMSGDMTEDKFVSTYVKEGIKSDQAIQRSIDANGRNYTNQNWSAKSRTEWEAEGRTQYNKSLNQAEQYSVGDIAKRLGVGINYTTPTSEARRILGNSTYDALLNTARQSARKAVDSHKRRR